jgi:hypothetical protein
LDGSLEFGYNLVSDVVDMSTTFGCADAVDERYLLELSITKTTNDFPAICLLLHDLGKLLVLLIVQVEIAVIDKILNLDPLAV